MIVLLLAGCPPGDEELPATLGDCPQDSTITWTEAEPVFTTWCADCHSSALEAGSRQGAPVAVNYDSPEDAAVNDFVTWTQIHQQRMPLTGGPVPEEQAWIVWEWLSCGGPT